MRAQLRTAVPLCLAVLIACEGSGPIAPEERTPRTLIAGDYELTAAGQTVSTAWETYNVRFEGILSLSQDSSAPSRVNGTFRDLRETDGYVTGRIYSGTISGSIDATGALRLELTTPSGDFRWTGRGRVVDSQITGQWESTNPAAGGFSARRRDADTEAAEEIDYPAIDGVYVVDAPFTAFDPAWGDFTGHRYSAVLTLKRDERGPGLSGTFTDFQLADATGKKENWSASGTLIGSIARDGKIAIELTSATNPFTWGAQGTSNGRVIEGRWFRAGHLSGSFRAERR